MPKSKNHAYNNNNKENLKTEWIESQAKITRRSSTIPYDYFSFATLMDQGKALTNINYARTLIRAKATYPHKIPHIEAMEAKMRQRDNPKSTFGNEYMEYWNTKKSSQTEERVAKIIRKTRVKVVKATAKLMENTASDIALPSQMNEVDQVNYENHQIQIVTPNQLKIEESAKICRDLKFPLGELNIIDLTDDVVRDFFKQALSSDDHILLNQPLVPPWVEEPACKRLLDALSEEDIDQRDLSRIIRTPIMKPEDYRPLKHYDLRAVENIAGNWIDMMCAPSNTIRNERGERTSAIDGVILVLRNLFRPFNDIVNIRWIEIEEDGTKRHKWDGVVNAVDGSASVMLIEFAGGFVNVDPNKLENDTIKVYRNAARLLNNKNSSPDHPPCIYVVISHHFKLYFETLMLVTDRVYVRTRNAVMDVPYSPRGLRVALQQLPEVFAWRNMVISSVKNDVAFNNSHIETLPVPSTP